MPVRRKLRRGHLAVLGALLVLAIGSGFMVESLTQGADASLPSGWNIVTSPSTGADDVVLGSTCANTMDCWAVGISIANISSNSTFAPIVESWNGTDWSLANLPPLPDSDGGGFFAVTCVTSSDCWAVGAVLGPAGNGSPTGTLTEHWDGAAWSMVPSPTPSGAAGGILQSVSCASSSDCWAVGYGTDQNGGALNSVLEHWDGSAWATASSPATGQTYDQLDGITCLSDSNCWAVGSAGPVQQNPNFLPIFPAAPSNQGLIERWNGSVWSIVPGVTEPSPLGRVPQQRHLHRRFGLLGLGIGHQQRRYRRRYADGALGRRPVVTDANAGSRQFRRQHSGLGVLRWTLSVLGSRLVWLLRWWWRFGLPTPELHRELGRIRLVD